ncbi:MAG: amidophosphoribosyltransferase [Promethearchaeota archaeon]
MLLDNKKYLFSKQLKVVHDHCGVFGIKHIDETAQVADTICQGLVMLQHRGQESAGISVHDGKEMATHKGPGLVTEAFDAQRLSCVFGYKGIGHVRYSTAGTKSIIEAQPLVVQTSRVSFAFGFNGNISNNETLREYLLKKGYVFGTLTDTEVITRLIIDSFNGTRDLPDAIQYSMEKLAGAYSVLLLTKEGEIIAFRDPLGFRPLVLGKTNVGTSLVASEDVAFRATGGQLVDDVKPGELVILGDNGIKRHHLIKQEPKYCMFEYVYFARPDSNINGFDVYTRRERLGRILAQQCPADADIVIPVPDSGRIAALGYSDESGIPYREGLTKNRFIWRTFIIPGQANREKAVFLKLNVVKEIVHGKKVVLIDDSIVRGTTMRGMVKLLRAGGAREVHVRSSCPPLIAPCFMGIDFPSQEELIAGHKTPTEIKRIVGADSLEYMPLDGLIEALEIPKNNLCLACLTKEYPCEVDALKNGL